MKASIIARPVIVCSVGKVSDMSWMSYRGIRWMGTRWGSWWNL